MNVVKVLAYGSKVVDRRCTRGDALRWHWSLGAPPRDDPPRNGVDDVALRGGTRDWVGVRDHGATRRCSAREWRGDMALHGRCWNDAEGLGRTGNRVCVHPRDARISRSVHARIAVRGHAPSPTRFGYLVAKRTRRRGRRARAALCAGPRPRSRDSRAPRYRRARPGSCRTFRR